MLTKSSEYSIRALVFVQLVNWESRRPGVKEIAKEIDAPTAFTAKILHVLTTHQVLLSMKGRGGGFYFAGNQSDLTLFDVIMITEGDRLFTKCGFGLKNCNNAYPCPLHEEYLKIRESILQLAKSETIASLAGKIKEGRAILNSNMLKIN
ncbi:MAG: Rrf2 family transcriptional regulator [Bacteroidales bacterium]|nr:Rrf2 family transcriptional regulator [Bacteroidales bacterium]